MSNHYKCLFSAPFEFLGELQQKFNEIFPTTFREIWGSDDVRTDKNVYAWVVNPGQRFIIDERVLDNFPDLKVIVTPSTGTNHIDKKACQARDISVLCLLDDRKTLNSISASAEFTFLLLLNALRRLDLAKGEVVEKRWRAKEDAMRGYELNGKQVGLVGMGRIGQRLAKWCQAFDASAAYYDPYVKNASYPKWALEKIFEESDIVCVCCLLTDETKGLINKDLLKRLKKGACFINTSRGEVVVEGDLIDVLKTRNDLRIALDVLDGEVTNTHLSSPLVDMVKSGRIVVTPHIAGATYESQTKAAYGALNLLQQFMRKQSVGQL